jgi:hypothetical protein
VAIGANGGQVANFVRDRLVFDHATRWGLWRAASNAINLPRLTDTSVSFPPPSKKLHQVLAENKNGANSVAGLEALFNPFAHGVLVDIEERSSLSY